MSEVLYKEEYPEHLKHLYMAEAEKLRNEARTNRVNRMKMRMKGPETGKELEAEDAVDAVDADAAGQSAAAGPEISGGSKPTDSLPGNSEPAAATESER